MEITALSLARRFLGMKEVAGTVSNPAILAMLQLVDRSVQDDETAWCSAFVNAIAFLLALPMSNSLSARSWLKVGVPVELAEAKPGFDVVILSRGSPAPGPDVIAAPGHVGFYMTRTTNQIVLLGGNQGNSVSVAGFPLEHVLGIRRL